MTTAYDLEAVDAGSDAASETTTPTTTEPDETSVEPDETGDMPVDSEPVATVVTSEPERECDVHSDCGSGYVCDRDWRCAIGPSTVIGPSIVEPTGSTETLPVQQGGACKLVSLVDLGTGSDARVAFVNRAFVVIWDAGDVVSAAAFNPFGRELARRDDIPPSVALPVTDSAIIDGNETVARFEDGRLVLVRIEEEEIVLFALDANWLENPASVSLATSPDGQGAIISHNLEGGVIMAVFVSCH